VFASFCRYLLLSVSLLLYAVVTALLAGLLVWSHLDYFLPPAPYPATPIDTDHLRPAMARTMPRWSITKRLDPQAPDGYEIDVQDGHIVIDTEKAATAWERIVAMRLLNHEPPAAILPVLAHIQDQHERAIATKALLAALRSGHLPPHPFRPVPGIVPAPPLDIMSTPSFVSSADDPLPKSRAVDASTAGPSSKPVLSAAQQQSLETEWRKQLDAIRQPVVQVLDDLSEAAKKFDAGSDQADLYLTIADNYAQTLEPEKALAASKHAADSLAAAHQQAHSFVAAWSAWVRTNGFPVAIAVLTFLWLLSKELWTKLVQHYGGRWLANRLNSGELAVVYGVSAPKPGLILPEKSKNRQTP
jgi:hypothetical protein